MSGTALTEALARRRVLVCVGAGGVGKTTTAAALGVRAARLGRTTLVCTIDPAKRLANALGLSALGNKEARVELGEDGPGALFAMMLDMKQSWDELIERFAPKEQQERILNNRFYRALSTALAGSQEYIALEKLWELRTQRDYALIVLDTPPTAHALDFLEAPSRILDFLDNEAARWFLGGAVRAGKVGLQLLNVGSSLLLRTLSRFTGMEMLEELAGFMRAISGMNEDFRERARAVRDLLASEQTAFVLVTTPHPERLAETVHFWELLRQNRMEVAAVVVNRVHPPVPQEERVEAERLTGALREKVERTLAEDATLAAANEAALGELERRCHPTPLVRVPRLPTDVHDLEGLAEAGEFLVGEGG